MRLMRILIVLILCIKSLYRALPVQSKALENIDDQLFWQAAWFSEDTAPASPFTSDSKKITAKSIFITPNFVNQPAAPYCPDGYRIDNGKCIKIINVQQTSEEVLATRLASLITTDDTTNFDYDYDSVEEEESSNKNEDQEDIKLPLVPILHESAEDTESSNSNNNLNAKNITVKDEQEHQQQPATTTDNINTFRDTHTDNKTDSIEIIITTLSNDDVDDVRNGSHTAYATVKTSVDEITTVEETSTEVVTEMNSNENETSLLQHGSDDKQYVEPAATTTKIIDSTSNDEMDILSNSTVLDYNENSQTEVAIIESSISDFLLNDSLIMINGNESMLSSLVDYDDITTVDPFYDEKMTQQSVSDNVSITTEQKQLVDESVSTMNSEDDVDATASVGSDEVTNKFLYHVPIIETTTESAPPQTSSTMEAEKGNKLKFPDEEINGRVRFPDDDDDAYNNNHEIATTSSRIQSRLLPATTRFSWPRENNNNHNHRLTTNIFQFWNQQPLLNDFQASRENSKSFRVDDFFPYTRKVQIVTPQRYNY